MVTVANSIGSSIISEHMKDPVHTQNERRSQQYVPATIEASNATMDGCQRPIGVADRPSNSNPHDDSRLNHGSLAAEEGCQTPIAVCGMAVRLPAGLDEPQKLWDFLLAKGDARSEVPNSRFHVSAFHDSSGKPGTVITRHGYFLDQDIEQFDASFFSMGRMEVDRLDPQQRLMLEVARDCLEDAGAVNFRDQNIGCYVGSLGQDWCEMSAKERQNWGNYRLTGHGDFTLSNRVSYELNLKGPSMTIRTACSASLVALHEACVAITRGDCDSAIVGGVNLIMTPDATIAMTEQRLLSPDGSCKSFSADADGYARGEGITAIYIKKLAQAIEDKDPIRAVIRGTATNHDGKTSSLTVPSSEAQVALIKRAYEVAGIKDFSQTGFVECHATGTAVGDPIEAEAVAQIFGEHGIIMGSIKPNFGHTEGASGLLSFIKTVMALEKKTIPPNIKFSHPNSNIPFERAKLVVPLDPTPWPNDRMYRASVNSFGIGGTNAHAIVEAAPSNVVSVIPSQTTRRPSLLLFSANSSASLSKAVDNYRGFLEKQPDLVDDLAYTLAIRREHLPQRTFAIMNRRNIGASEPALKVKHPHKVIMVFTGQGAQWSQMGQDLLDAYPVFLESIKRLDDILQNMHDNSPEWRIEEELRRPANKRKVNTAEFAQPLCAAIQIALVDTLASLGIRPSAVVGHSSGEIAAAYAAGAITAEEAIKNALCRGTLIKGDGVRGAMAAIGMGWNDTKEFLLPGVIIACDNSPNSVTVSGDVDSVEALITRIHQSKPNVLARKLQVDRAYHSFHMAPHADEYRTTLQKFMSERRPVCPFFSSVTGCLLQDTTLGPKYWQENLASPVLFRSALSSIFEHSVAENSIFLEIGPHSALAGPIRQTSMATSRSVPYVAAMVRNQSCVESFLTAIGKLHMRQVAVNMQVLFQNGKCLKNLPPYPWDHTENYWYESRLSLDYRRRKHRQHDLLGCRIHDTSDLEPSWRNIFHTDSAPWIRDHKVGDDIVFPFAAYAAMAGEAVRQLTEVQQGYRLQHVNVSTALVVNDGHPTEIVTTLRRKRLTDTLDSEWWEFLVTSHDGQAWIKHCSGLVMAEGEERHLAPILTNLPRKVDARRWFNTLRDAGLDLGPAFCNITALCCDTMSHNAAALVLNKAQVEAPDYHLHPTAIDGALQLLGVAVTKGEPRKLRNRLPVSCEDLHVARSSADFAVSASTEFRGTYVSGSVHGVSDEGANVLSMTGLKLKAVERVEMAEEAGAPSTARFHWAPDTRFIDLTKLLSLPIDRSAYMSSLDKLGCLCLLHTQISKMKTANYMPHIQHFSHWIDKQSCHPYSKSVADHDTAGLLEEIEGLVKSLLGTPGYPVAVVLAQICSNMAAIYSGKALSWEDLVPQDTVASFHKFISSDSYLDILQKVAHSKPNLRVLEIASRSGTPSKDILERLTLPDGQALWSKYTLMSSAFVASHADQSKVSNVEYLTFDIGASHAEEAIRSQEYDLVIANNVLHSTPNIGQSLRNLRKMIRYNGHLVIQELCPSSKWINYVLGTDPKWWCGVRDGRSEEPYISAERWQRELAMAGFGNEGAVVMDSIEPFQINATVISQPSSALHPPKRISVLFNDRTSAVESALQALSVEGYDVEICSIKDTPPSGQDVLALLDSDEPFFESLDCPSFEAFQAFLQKLGGAGILWVTGPSQIRCSDPRFAQSLGFARTMRSEQLIDFTTCEVDDIVTSMPLILQLLTKFQHRGEIDDNLGPDHEYVILDGVVYISRLYPFSLRNELSSSQKSHISKLDVEVPGRLNTLKWLESSVLPQLKPNEVEVGIHSVGMNFRDVLVAMNLIEGPDKSIGLEAAGTVRGVGSQVKNLSVGDRVAVVDCGISSTDIITQETLCIKIPDDMEFTQAATFFLPFVTALQSLVSVGGLEKGQSVLIHSACGGVGLAAIQVAQMLEADVFTTVGTEEKVQHLMETYKIPRERIFSSRDDSFVKGIQAETDGQGVDLVLNSLSGELLHASWKCVAPFGKLVEIGKRDLLGHGKLDMNPFLANRSYCCVALEAYNGKRSITIQRLLRSALELYQKGQIRPIHPVKVFDVTSTQEAFRYMQGGHHIGKICISNIESLKISHSDTKPLQSIEPVHLGSSASYLLIGGLGGLGRAISIWMIERGARHLVFLSRQAGGHASHGPFIQELNSMGCQVQLIQGSVTNFDDVQRAIHAAGNSLKGILQMSMVLHDQTFPKMSFDQWEAVCQPKIQGTWHLHKATMAAGLDLDFFVLFSSLSGVIGNHGQANYASANTFLDAFVRYRNQLGLQASAIDIGPVGDVGYLSGSPTAVQRMTANGFKMLREQEVLDTLSAAMAVRVGEYSAVTQYPDAHVDGHNIVLGLSSDAPLDDPTNRALWKNDRRMAVYHNTRNEASGNTAVKTNLKSFIIKAKADPSVLKDEETPKYFAKEIGSKLSSLLMKPEEDMSLSLPLADLGLDSLVGTELAAWWKQVFGLKTSVLEMLSKGSLASLGHHAAEGLLRAVSAERGVEE